MMNCSDVQLGLSQNNVAGISLKCRHCVRYQQPMLVFIVRYEKIHVFAMSCWNGIPNSCYDLINIWHFMRIYGSLKPQMVTIN